MERINVKLPKVVSKANSKRAALIEEFVARLNLERKGTKYKPVTGRQIAVKTAHLKLPDLYYFWSVCKEARNFSKCFWGSLKVKK